MSDWQSAFEANSHKVGRAVHEAWMAEKQRQGFADHVWVERPIYARAHRVGTYLSKTVCERCDLLEVKHHPDMLDYDDLPDNVREYDIQTGVVGFRMGYETASEPLEAVAEALQLLVPLVAMNDNGYTRCCACGGWWHSIDSPRHKTGCLLMRAILAAGQTAPAADAAPSEGAK